MTQRLDAARLSPALMQKYLEFSLSMKDSAVGRTIRDLVNIRASQINGCAFCLDMHVKQAKLAGERELRLYHIAIWRESPLFDARERAALEWTEALTRLPAEGVADEIYDRVRAVLSEQEISDLSFSIVAINGWNRLSIGFRNEPGAMDAQYGLDKAGLS